MTFGQHNPPTPTPTPTQPVPQQGSAAAMLRHLCGPFAIAGLPESVDVVEPDDIPRPDDALLVHHEHMTVALERHFGAPVAVRVLREAFEGDAYTRLIELTAGGRTVECGIARLNLQMLSAAVREEILAKQAPLGAILIRHDVHRRVKPRHFLRLGTGGSVMKLFTAGLDAAPVYGRLGTIYCDDEPAIELLEVVVNTGRATPA